MASQHRPGKEIEASEPEETAPPAITYPITGKTQPLEIGETSPKIGDLRESISIDFSFTCYFGIEFPLIFI